MSEGLEVGVWLAGADSALSRKSSDKEDAGGCKCQRKSVALMEGMVLLLPLLPALHGQEEA